MGTYGLVISFKNTHFNHKTNLDENGFFTSAHETIATTQDRKSNRARRAEGMIGEQEIGVRLINRDRISLDALCMGLWPNQPKLVIITGQVNSLMLT